MLRLGSPDLCFDCSSLLLEIIFQLFDLFFVRFGLVLAFLSASSIFLASSARLTFNAAISCA